MQSSAAIAVYFPRPLCCAAAAAVFRPALPPEPSAQCLPPLALVHVCEGAAAAGSVTVAALTFAMAAMGQVALRVQLVGYVQKPGRFGLCARLRRPSNQRRANLELTHVISPQHLSLVRLVPDACSSRSPYLLPLHHPA